MKRMMFSFATLFACLASAEDPPTVFSYDQFLDRVRDGSITSVTFVNYSTITGTHSHANGSGAFQADHPMLEDDPLLLDFLREHDVSVEIESLSLDLFGDMPWFFLAMEYGLPVIMIALLYFIYRRIKGLEISLRQSLAEKPEQDVD